MKRNLTTVIVVAVLAGLATGIFALGFPWYCEFRAIDFRHIGWIAGLAALVTFVVKIGLGRLSDRFGRKYTYTFSIALAAIACFAIPFTASFGALVVLSAAMSMSRVLRNNFQAIVVFDNTQSRFRKIFGRARGLELVVMGMGTLIAGRMLSGSSLAIRDYTALFWTAGSVGMAAVAAMLVFYREPEPPARANGAPTGTWRTGISKELVILAAAGLLFNVGISTSHVFAIPFFFGRKFGVSKPGVGWIQMLHMLSLGVPMLISPVLFRSRLKSVFLITVVWEGCALMAAALVPAPFLVFALVLWLTHDPLGAACWIPIQSEMVQRYSRPDKRGADASLAMAVMNLGPVIGPILCGYLMEWKALGDAAISAPFFASGAIIVLSSTLLIPLLRTSRRAADAAGEPPTRP